MWLTPAETPEPAAGCGHCLSSTSGPQCRAQLSVEPCAEPELQGPPDLLNRVLLELDRAAVDPDAGRGIVALRWVEALHIGDGEAELSLSFAASCGPGKALSDAAFQTLRRMLPDTDVYVRHRR